MRKSMNIAQSTLTAAEKEIEEETNGKITTILQEEGQEKDESEDVKSSKTLQNNSRKLSGNKNSSAKKKRRKVSPRKILEKKLEMNKRLPIVQRNIRLNSVNTSSSFQRSIEKRDKRRIVVKMRRDIINQERLCKYFIKANMHDLNKVKRKLKYIGDLNTQLKKMKQGYWIHIVQFLSMLELLNEFFWKIKLNKFYNFLWDSRFRRLQNILRAKVHKRAIKFGDMDLTTIGCYFRFKLGTFNYNHAKMKARNIVRIVLKKMILPQKFLKCTTEIYNICKNYL